MTITPEDIVTLRPNPEDILSAVRYAIKSSVPYTYNRMGKDAWKRVARVARGKVNECLIQRLVESLEIQSVQQEKSHRKHDDFDFIFKTRRGQLEADLKTFHVLTMFIEPPRAPFSVTELLSSVDHSSPNWHLFFPMLVPKDYKLHKEIYVFAVSVESPPDNNSQPVLSFPWMRFPTGDKEQFLVDPKAIKRRAHGRNLLNVSLNWPEGLAGKGNIVYEVESGVRQRDFNLATGQSETRKKLTSFLALQLNDEAHSELQKHRKKISLTAHAGENPPLTSLYGTSDFREVFPRQDYVLYVLGWIDRQEFEQLAKELPEGMPCYFYPPQQGQRTQHEAGTKTANHYVLAGQLHPISSLKEA